MAEECTLAELEGIEKRLETLSIKYSSVALQVDGKSFCSEFCKLVEEYTCLWRVAAPQLRVLEVALCYFFRASSFFPPHCDHVHYTLSSLALSVFELLLFFDQKEFNQQTLKHLKFTFQECHLTLARHPNIYLLQLKNVIQGGGPWGSRVLRAMLAESDVSQSEVDGFLSSESSFFLELRVRYLLAAGRGSEAAVLARHCVGHLLSRKRLFFLQVFLAWLCKTDQQERLHTEVSGLRGGDAVRLICSLEGEEEDGVLLSLCRAALVHQLSRGDVPRVWELVFIWSKLHGRLQTSRLALLEESRQLLQSVTNVAVIFPFIRVLQEELGDMGLQFCVELCAQTLHSGLACDGGTRSLIYKLVAGLLPNDLEVCRACALLVFFQERTVEAYKMVVLLYMLPDQEYHAENSPVGNHVRFDLLQVLKKGLHFDPEFWDVVAIRSNCLKLLSGKVLSAALEAFMEETWFVTHCATPKKDCKLSPQADARKRPSVEKNDMPPKRTKPCHGVVRPSSENTVQRKTRSTQGTRPRKDPSGESLRRSFWQLDKANKTNISLPYDDMEHKRITRFSEKSRPKRRIRRPRWLLEDSGALEENDNAHRKVRNHRMKRRQQKEDQDALVKTSTLSRSGTKYRNSNVAEKQTGTTHQKGLSLDYLRPASPAHVILELSLPDNELPDIFTEEGCNRKNGLPPVLLYKTLTKEPHLLQVGKTVHRKRVIIRAPDEMTLARQLHCYAGGQKGAVPMVPATQSTPSVVTRSSAQASPAKRRRGRPRIKPLVEMKVTIASQTPVKAQGSPGDHVQGKVFRDTPPGTQHVTSPDVSTVNTDSITSQDAIIGCGAKDHWVGHNVEEAMFKTVPSVTDKSPVAFNMTDTVPNVSKDDDCAKELLDAGHSDFGKDLANVQIEGVLDSTTDAPEANISCTDTVEANAISVGHHDTLSRDCVPGAVASDRDHHGKEDLCGLISLSEMVSDLAPEAPEEAIKEPLSTEQSPMLANPPVSPPKTVPTYSPNVGEMSDHSTCSPDVGEKSDRSTCSPDVGETYDRSTCSPDVGEKSDRSTCSPDVGEKSDHSTCSPDVGEKSDHSTCSPDVSEKSDRSTCSPDMGEKSVRSTCNPDVGEKSDRSTCSPDVGEKSDRFTCSPKVNEKSDPSMHEPDREPEPEPVEDPVAEPAEDGMAPESEESRLEYCCTLCNKVFRGKRVVVHAMFHYRRDNCMFCGVLFKDDLLAMMHLSEHIDKLKKLKESEHEGQDAEETQEKGAESQPATPEASTRLRRGRPRKSLTIPRPPTLPDTTTSSESRKLRSKINVSKGSMQPKVNGHVKRPHAQMPGDEKIGVTSRPESACDVTHGFLPQQNGEPEEGWVNTSVEKESNCASVDKEKTKSTQPHDPTGKQEETVAMETHCPVDSCPWRANLSRNRVALLYHALEDHHGDTKPLEMAFHLSNSRCSVCLRVLWSFQHYQHHVERHRLAPRHPCLHKGCDARFKTGMEMRRHTRRHNPLQAGCCLPGCSELFICLWALNLHEREHYAVKDSKSAKKMSLKAKKPDQQVETTKHALKSVNSDSVKNPASVKDSLEVRSQATETTGTQQEEAHTRVTAQLFAKENSKLRKHRKSKGFGNLEDTIGHPSGPTSSHRTQVQLRHKLSKRRLRKSVEQTHPVSASSLVIANRRKRLKARQINMNKIGIKSRDRLPASTMSDKNSSPRLTSETTSPEEPNQPSVLRTNATSIGPPSMEQSEMTGKTANLTAHAYATEEPSETHTTQKVSSNENTEFSHAVNHARTSITKSVIKNSTAKGTLKKSQVSQKHRRAPTALSKSTNAKKQKVKHAKASPKTTNNMCHGTMPTSQNPSKCKTTQIGQDLTVATMAQASQVTTEAVVVPGTTEAAAVAGTTEATQVTGTTIAAAVARTTDTAAVAGTTEAVAVAATTEATAVAKATEAAVVFATTEASQVTMTTEAAAVAWTTAAAHVVKVKQIQSPVESRVGSLGNTVCIHQQKPPADPPNNAERPKEAAQLGYRKTFIRPLPTAYLDERFTTMPKRRKAMAMFVSSAPKRCPNVTAPPRQRCVNCFVSFSDEEQLQDHLREKKCSSMFGFDSDEDNS